MYVRTKHAVALSMITALASCVAGAAQTATRPHTPPAPLDPRVEKILTRLEQRQVHDLRARLTWQQRYIYDTEEDAVTKRGRICYQQTDPVARFLIEFNEKISGSGRRDKLQERHLFDGCWYVELNSRTKTVVRREIRRPDNPGDPYKVGRGVFPLPFGQKKDDILREFGVEFVEPVPRDPPASDHLRLTPLAQTQTGQTYKRLDFWISREGSTVGLPIKVRVAKKDGTGKVNSQITIAFDEVELNPGLSNSVFEIKKPPGYHEEIERLQPAAPPPGTAEATP